MVCKVQVDEESVSILPSMSCVVLDVNTLPYPAEVSFLFGPPKSSLPCLDAHRAYL